MKNKILLLLLVLFIFTGCSFIKDSPTKAIENLLEMYQKQDTEVLNDLDKVLNSSNYTDSQKVRYKELMKKQYKDLTYKIKNETINKDNATVECEIEVYDYSKAIQDSDLYLESNKQEFLNTDNTINYEKYNDYKLDNIKNIKDRVTYTINFTLHKDKDNKDLWIVDELSDLDTKKIHGLYY